MRSGFLAQPGNAASLQIARQPDAAGHDDPVVRAVPLRGLSGGNEKFVDVHGSRHRQTRPARGDLFDFIAQLGRLFEIFLFDGLVQFLLQRFEPVGLLA